jgi:tetratricopeptide (TPR) repeat protein
MMSQPTHTDPDRRRWRVPAPLVSGRTGLQGLSVLEEFPNELGTILWQSLRTVRRWASAPPAIRRKLFLPGAHRQRITDIEAVLPTPALQEPLTTLAELLKNSSKIEAAQIGAACARISEWAQSQNARATEFDFVQAAALASPTDPRLGLAVARTARDRAEYPVAEAWYQRTIALARRARDWDIYARAYIGLGKMWRTRGAYPAARKHFLKAVRVASRQRLRDAQGMALHDLFAVEAQGHRDEQAQAYAAAALQAYGAAHRLLPNLAHDVAYFWMERGHFAAALPVIQAVMPHLPIRYQLRAQGSLARAAGAVGDELVFEVSWQQVMASPDDALDRADTLMEAAQGAASLARWTLAESAAHRALEISRQRREAEISHKAEALLESVRHERLAKRRSAARHEKRSNLSESVMEPGNALTRDLVRSLAIGVQR